MVRIFLDANFYIDVANRAREKWQRLRGNLIFISPISTHIVFYTRKLKVPNQEIIRLQKQIGIVPLTKYLVDKALVGPTSDFEDNVQLHSAAEADCDFFLTEDKRLLNLKFFGKTRMVSDLKTT